MKKVMNSKVLLSILSLVLVAAMALSFAACGNDNGKGNGEEKSFVFTVIYADGDGTSFDITTDAETVGEALIAEGLIAGTEGEYGLMVDTVTAIKYDYNTDGIYWAFYINNEYAMTGVDSTKITDGATYSFVATKAE